jgi:P-type Cu+ transporter
MAQATDKVKDPVCGMMIDPATAAAKRTRAGKDYYFCAQGCAKAFDSNPEKYART